MMQTATAATVYLKDYAVPAFLISEVGLDIPLFEDDTRVREASSGTKQRAAAEQRRRSISMS
jgi:hypothetical protein